MSAADDCWGVDISARLLVFLASHELGPRRRRAAPHGGGSDEDVTLAWSCRAATLRGKRGNGTTGRAGSQWLLG